MFVRALMCMRVSLSLSLCLRLCVYVRSCACAFSMCMCVPLVGGLREHVCACVGMKALRDARRVASNMAATLVSEQTTSLYDSMFQRCVRVSQSLWDWSH